jgi:hypothetical protein
MFMTSRFRLVSLMALAGMVSLGACAAGSSPSTGSAGASGNAGQSGSAGSGSAGSSSSAGSDGSAGSGSAGSGSAGSGSAGNGSAGAVGSAGASGSAGSGSAGSGSAGAGGSAGTTGAAGAGGGGTPPTGPFSCTEYFGAYLTMEWWNQNFEGQPGMDGSKWELKWHHHGHITEWAKPDSPFWSDTGDPNNDAMGAPIQSACTANAHAPDRIVFLALSWILTKEEDWIKNLNADVDNLVAKYPSAKRIELMTMIRCPMNKQCNPNAMYGAPDSDTNAGHQDCQVPDYADSAIAKVIAARPNLLALGPQFEMTACNPAHDGAHMTGADNKIAAQKMAAFYSARP